MSWHTTRHGTHIYYPSDSGSYATVTDSGKSAKLMIFRKDNELQPDESNHPTVALAKATAEKWLKNT